MHAVQGHYGSVKMLTQCKVTLLGDGSEPRCAALCQADKPCCGLCDCSTCSWCQAGEGTAVAALGQIPPAVAVDSAPLLEEMQSRFVQRRGVALRVLDCSLPCQADQTWSVGAHGAPCIVHELSRKLAPASVIRWDLPVSLFHGGRCFDDTRKVVTSTGIGFIFCPPTKKHRQSGQAPRRSFVEGVAFAHDAWTPKHTELRGLPHGRPGAGVKKLAACDPARKNDSRAYAEARFSRTRPHLATAQHARAYMGGFLNSSWNCFWPSKSWARALDEQRAFTQLLAERVDLGANYWAEMHGRPGTMGATYNQVHVSHGVDSLCGAFYVNDTLTPRHGHSAHQRHQQRVAAANAAAEAQQLAVLAARIAGSMGVKLPILQYRPSADAIEPRAVVDRAARGPAAADIRSSFGPASPLPRQASL